MSKHLTDSERLRILEEYLVSSQSKYAIAKKYRIAQCLINDWLRKFGLEDKIPQDPMKTSPVSKSDLTLKEREESERLRQENRLLKTRLKREKECQPEMAFRKNSVNNRPECQLFSGYIFNFFQYTSGQKFSA